MPTLPLIEIIGAPASPYTRKMIALLRYRQLEHRVHWGDPAGLLAARGLPKPKVALLPTVLLATADGQEVLIDSSPIIRRLDQTFYERQVRPCHDPALAMIDSLIEDFADEWGTKLMFHYRWNFQADIDYCATTLPLAMTPTLSNQQAGEFGRAFADRQISRLRYVGSNAQTAPIIEAAYARLLRILDDLFASQRFTLGDRPAAGDFALFGQLSQLALYDPTPRALAASLAPRVVTWTSTAEDLSGLDVSEARWKSIDQQPPQLRALLSEIGRVYAPVLMANANAAQAGDNQWQTAIDGAQWQQDTFPYQVKCLAALRAEFSKLLPMQQTQVLALLDGTGCEALFADA